MSVATKVEKSAQSPERFDAIVIGSGIGGLTAAAVLAKLQKKRVLVLERHSEPGGLTHSFSRGRYRWDVGLHYVGRQTPGELQHDVLAFLTNGAVRWRQVCSPFERFVVPGARFDVSADARTYVRDLIERFPSQAVAIRRYFRDVGRASLWLKLFYLENALVQPFSAIVGAVRRGTGALARVTLDSYLRAHITDPALRALLASQWGDYGAPPEECSFVIHATVVNHYLKGAYYPERSSHRIPAYLEYPIEEAGGMVLVNRHVEEILVEQNRAVGVTVRDMRFKEPRRAEYRAGLVISCAGARNTFDRMLPSLPEADRAQLLGGLEAGYSAVSLYLGLNGSPEKLGVKGENVWIHETLDHTDMAEQTRLLLEGAPGRCYVSFPSLRNGATDWHTVEIIAIAEYGPFARWADLPTGARGDEYERLKSRIAEGLLSLAERHLPGLRSMVVYSELATPLTLEHFGGRPLGSMYGCKPTPARFERQWYTTRTPVRGLYLGGSDACTLGVVGAIMGGVAAAGAAMGPLGFVRTVAAARIYYRRKQLEGRVPFDTRTKGLLPRSGDKVYGQLVDKVQLTPRVVELTYELDRSMEFEAGQYARIRHSEADYGAYSIASMKDRAVRFLIDTGNAGGSSRYFNEVRPGDWSLMRLPIGSFRLRDSSRRKAFVATGTGVSPLLAMMEELARQGHNEEIDLYFGCRYAGDAFVGRYVERLNNLQVRSTLCVSREDAPGAFRGRVTHALAGLNGTVSDTDFYVCGNPDMVRDVCTQLRDNGAAHIYTENY